jgi:quercetin dioxygenase-like cupin family protein
MDQREKRHAFVINRAGDARFESGGLRSFFTYRDLGVAAATSGEFGAQVIRATTPCTQGTGPHRHTLNFQLVYVLKGTARFWYEGQGEIELRAGDSVYQPPGIVHELLSCSKACELLEITMPASFTTDPASPGATAPGA